MARAAEVTREVVACATAQGIFGLLANRRAFAARGGGGADAAAAARRALLADGGTLGGELPRDCVVRAAGAAAGAASAAAAAAWDAALAETDPGLLGAHARVVYEALVANSGALPIGLVTALDASAIGAGVTPDYHTYYAAQVTFLKFATAAGYLCCFDGKDTS